MTYPITHAAADHTLVPASVFQKVKHECAKRFPETVPHSLPPERDIGHTIPTETRHISPFKSLIVGSLQWETLRLTFSVRLQRVSGDRL